MNKSCFIIPIYPPHYHYLTFLNNQPENLEFDIYLILSYKSDLVELEQLNYNKSYKTIVIEDYLNGAIINDILNRPIEQQGIITFKKYFGLFLLKDKYDYLATCDAEIDFVSYESVNEKFENFCLKKTIIGSNVDGERNVSNTFEILPQSTLIEVVEKINKTSASLFNNDEIEKLSKFNFRFYFWFSDIPVYDTKILNNFFKHINFNENEYENFIRKLNYYIFDYITYIYYCFLYEDYKILNIQDHGINRNWSLESMPYDIYLEVLNLKYEPMCVIYNTYLENKDNLNNVILTYHKNDGRYVYL
jgi:hypothetical protein